MQTRASTGRPWYVQRSAADAGALVAAVVAASARAAIAAIRDMAGIVSAVR
jgi:hypothetical protein